MYSRNPKNGSLMERRRHCDIFWIVNELLHIVKRFVYVTAYVFLPVIVVVLLMKKQQSVFNWCLWSVAEREMCQTIWKRNLFKLGVTIRCSFWKSWLDSLPIARLRFIYSSKYSVKHIAPASICLHQYCRANQRPFWCQLLSLLPVEIQHCTCFSTRLIGFCTGRFLWLMRFLFAETKFWF